MGSVAIMVPCSACGEWIDADEPHQCEGDRDVPSVGNPLLEIEGDLRDAVSWIDSAIDQAADLATMGHPDAEGWAKKWISAKALLVAPYGLVEGAKAEEQYLDDLADKADAQGY